MKISLKHKIFFIGVFFVFLFLVLVFCLVNNERDIVEVISDSVDNVKYNISKIESEYMLADTEKSQ